MNYEKAYKEVLERANKYYNANTNKGYKEIFEDIFHEFKESEDERIRKGIICGMNALKEQHKETFASIPINDCIAWLEKQGEPQDKGEISDGYHTFNELYYYRMLYNAAFFNMLPKEWVHKSKKHNDGEECFGGGWFIVMANLPTGQISNHYELKDWNLFQIPEKEVADKWDGHTPQEAADRLHKYLLEKQGEHKCDCKYVGCHVNDVKRWCHKKQAEILYEKCNTECPDYQKQGKQKPIEQDTETHDLWVYIREWNDKFGRLPKDEDELASCIDYVMKRQKPADKVEQKHAWSEKHIADVFEKVGLARIVRRQGNDQLTNAVQSAMIELSKQQNPAYSEEDRKHIDNIISLLNQAKERFVRESGQFPSWITEILWLESIKDRVQPQLTQEWNEEDEEMYKEVLTDIIYAKNDLKTKRCLELSKRAMKAFNWFSKRYKSLRPQSKWKPSEEQLRAIINSAQGLYQCKEKEVLLDLYEQLKNL